MSGGGDGGGGGGVRGMCTKDGSYCEKGGGVRVDVNGKVKLL